MSSPERGGQPAGPPAVGSRRSAIPRVLLILPSHWERALLRAQLIEGGCDAVGAPDPESALVYPADAPDRGPVRLVVVDQGALPEDHRDALQALRDKHHDPAVLLLARPTLLPPPGRWAAVIHRPVTVEILARNVLDWARSLSGGSG